MTNKAAVFSEQTIILPSWFWELLAEAFASGDQV